MDFYKGIFLHVIPVRIIVPWWQGIRTVTKHLSLKIRKATSKNVVINEKKEKQCQTKIIYTNQGHLPTTDTSNDDFIDKLVFQYDVTILGNTFVDNRK